jgi:hypothetical protein
MNQDTLNGFSDELAGIIKSSGVLRNVGQRIVSGSRAVASDVGGALSAFNTPVQSLKSGAKEMFSTKHPFTAAMNVGLAALGAPEAFAKDDPTGAGRSRANRVASYTGNQLGSIMTTRQGFAGSLVGGMVGGKAGSIVGNSIDKVRNRIKPAATQSGVQQ